MIYKFGLNIWGYYKVVGMNKHLLSTFCLYVYGNYSVKCFIINTFKFKIERSCHSILPIGIVMKRGLIEFYEFTCCLCFYGLCLLAISRLSLLMYIFFLYSVLYNI